MAFEFALNLVDKIGRRSPEGQLGLSPVLVGEDGQLLANNSFQSRSANGDCGARNVKEKLLSDL